LAVALGEFDGDFAVPAVVMTDQRLHGRCPFVEDLGFATHVMLLLRDPMGYAIVESKSVGVSIEATPGLVSPDLSTITLDGVRPDNGPHPATEIELQQVARIVRLCYAGRALGAAQRGYELAVEHAKVRSQFGQLIGRFQAIQHKLADCLLRLDGSRLTLEAAALAWGHGMKDWQVFAASAFAYASASLRQVALEVHHTLGAIGYAEEHEMPRHFRRIHGDLIRCGGISRAREEIAAFLLDPDRPG
jgi:alkylation response protein AidB-like acyl-CoA dehydrogenase